MRKPALLRSNKLCLQTTTNKQIRLAVSIVAAATFVFPLNAKAAAGGIQICSPSSTCEIGEFLYDDDSAPLTGATCTISITNPADTAVVTDAAMTGQSDGWYSYDVSTSSTEGIYRTEVCCSASGDTICIDKTFEVKAAATGGTSLSTDDIAEAVWGYSDRTLSSFGTLVRDIWLNSTRSLTSLSVDSSSTSTSSVTNNIASNADLTGLTNTVNENRLLLEELVNKPIIETYLEDDGLDLGEKLDETRTLANSIYANTQYVRSKAGLIVSKWNSFSDLELKSNIADLVNVIGQTTDKKNNNTVIGASNWLSTSWDWDSADKIKTEVEKLGSLLDSVQVELETRGRSINSYNNIKNLSSNLDIIEDQIGDSTVSNPDQTLFGKLREVTLIANSLDKKNSQLGDVLAEWDTHSESIIRDELNEISQSVSTLNRVAQLRGFLAPLDSTVSGRDLKNSAFAIGGVIDTNRKVLARSSDSAIAATWLELGSIVFKSVIINPSSLISQNAELKYYLPPEVKEEDVKSIDDGLSVTYDVERDQYFVEGQFNLDPNETITASMSVEDIWIITDEELDAIAAQVEELVKPLEGTAYFAQGITLKSDIEVALNKISSLQSRAVTPEQKIRAYREASVELSEVGELTQALQILVTDVSAQSSLFAYVGGAQTFGVWGIILVIVAAVVFLTIYMRRLHHLDEGINKKKGNKKDKDSHDKHDTPLSPPFVFGQMGWRSLAQSALGLVVFGSIVSATTAFVIIKTTSADTSSNNLAVEESVETESVLADVDNAPVDEGFMNSETDEADLAESTGGENIVRIEVPQNSRLNIRAESNVDSEILSTLNFSTDATKIDEQNDFILVAIRMGERGEDIIEGWVHTDFVMTDSNRTKTETSAENQTEDVDKLELYQTISILDTPTGWLRVRTSPRGAELTTVNPGEKYKFLDETTSWFKIELSDGTEGWVSKEYSVLQ